jgi:hypothetical protein
MIAALGLTLLSVAQLAAQSRAAGRVVRLAGGDTLAVARVPVVLHRVGRSAQGPIDTIRADAGGRFAFRFAADTPAAYLLSVRYQGIEYFSSPIANNPARADTAIVILVADTSSSAPVTTRERTLLISRPDDSGTRAVVDWFVLQNAGERTRVAVDSLQPSWGAPLPPDAQNVELADARLSQFSPDALVFRRDSALIFAPLSPGQKELVLQYRIPGTLRRFSAPNAAGTESLFVMLEERAARVVAPPLGVADSQRLDGRLFQRWAGAMGAADRIAVVFPAAPPSPRIILALLVTLAAFGFTTLVVLRLRRRRLQEVAPHPLYLADTIARLDAAWLDRHGEAPPAEREAYLAERARLKSALSAALAAAQRRS